MDLGRRPSLHAALDARRRRLIVMCRVHADALRECLDAESSRVGNRHQLVAIRHNRARIDSAAPANQDRDSLTKTVAGELVGRDGDDRAPTRLQHDQRALAPTESALAGTHLHLLGSAAEGQLHRNCTAVATP